MAVRDEQKINDLIEKRQQLEGQYGALQDKRLKSAKALKEKIYQLDKKITEEQSKQNEVQNSIDKTLKDAIKKNRQLAVSGKDIFGFQRKINEVVQKRLEITKAENKEGNISNDLAGKLNNIGEDLIAQNYDLEGIKASQKDLTRESLGLANNESVVAGRLKNLFGFKKKDAKQLTEQEKKGIKNTQKILNQEAKRLKVGQLNKQIMGQADKLTGGMASKAQGMAKHVSKVGVKFAAAGAAVGIIGAGIALAIKSLKFASDLTDKFGAKFGVIGTQTSDFKSELQSASVEVISLGKGADDVAEVVGTLSSEFGIGLENAVDITEQILDTAVATGMATAEATKLFGTLMTIGGLTAQQTEDLTENTYQLAAQNRVNPVAVMQDIAGSAELIAKFGASNLDSISKAAVKARALGTNLSSVASAAEGFLDFQSSLTAEFEAETLLGKNLELTRARQLSLAGDLDGVLDEIVKNVGSEEKLNRMNVIQRRALAKALNMDVQQLTKIVSLQGKNVAKQKEFADLAGDDGMSALTNIINTLKEIGATVLLELGEPMENALISIKENFFTKENIEAIKSGLNSIVQIILNIASFIGDMFVGIYDFFAWWNSAPSFEEKFGTMDDLFGGTTNSVMGVNDFRSGGGSHLIVTPTGKMLQTNPRDTVFGTTKVNDFASFPEGGLPNETNTNEVVEKLDELISIARAQPRKISEGILEGGR